MNVCRPECTSRPAAMASRMIDRHVAGRRPPVGAMPINRTFGRPGNAIASASAPTIGMSWAGMNAETFWPARVESRTATT